MKLFVCKNTQSVVAVTLCMRVWIEIYVEQHHLDVYDVTLCMRVWIEMLPNRSFRLAACGHPLHEGVD